ncbi:hypothetical protein L6472_06115 [Prevotella sp. E13-17]|uniref:hypothetical protein n=1 Tax=Prevotella sp. E13-17 TaxID=2913616 RepID=UPI001EDB6030|nr:hypothetical protein [Prevotella sp. E13-17]UKK52153.1 hypothetical protein L6472_06115 [Prevotella sp. E13-17]
MTRVKSAIDEMSQEGTNLQYENADEEELDAIIKDKVVYALQYIIERAPASKLDSSVLTDLTTQAGFALAIDQDLIAHVTLPSNVLRVVTARLSSWSQSPAIETEQSQAYLMQLDEYARGSWDRPVTIWTTRGLEMFSAKSRQDSITLVGVVKPSLATVNSDVPVPIQLEGAYIYHLAGLVMTAFREEVADKLMTIASRYLGYEGEGGVQ